MSLKRTTFLKKLDRINPNTVVLSSWLVKQGISGALQYRYRESGWLKSIGVGAFVKAGLKEVGFTGALYALQKQAGLKVHIGGLSALNLFGLVHYGRLKNNWQLFANRDVALPKWFKNYKFSDKWELFKTNFLPDDLSLQEYKVEHDYQVTISRPERAILEALYLTPKNAGLSEIKEIFAMFRTLRPALLQELLENCKSIKVKRLFLYFAENANASWLKFDLSKIDLGKGVRVIQKGGKFNSKYKIMIGDLDDNE